MRPVFQQPKGRDWLRRAAKRWQESDWHLLLAFTRRSRAAHFVLAIALTAMSGLIDPAIARILGLLFEQFTRYNSGQLSSEDFGTQVTTYLWGLIVLGLISWLFNGLFYASWVGFGERQAETARVELFRNMLRNEMDWFERQEGGMSSLSARIQRYISRNMHDCRLTGSVIYMMLPPALLNHLDSSCKPPCLQSRLSLWLCTWLGT